jgi:hypothetical protein
VNELKLKEYSTEKVVYTYLPEGKGECGEVVYTFDNRNASVIKLASEDSNGRYGHKAALRLKEYVEEKQNLPINTVQAWS